MENAPVEQKAIRGMPNWAARWWVQPRKESDMMATGGEGWEWYHWIIAPSSSFKASSFASRLEGVGLGERSNVWKEAG